MKSILIVLSRSKNLIKKEWIKPLIINDVPIKAKKFSDRHNPYYARSDNTVNINDYSWYYISNKQPYFWKLRKKVQNIVN